MVDETGGAMSLRLPTFVLALVLTAALLASCGNSTSSTPSATSNAPPNATVWLCRPDAAPDPCTDNLDWTSVSASGARTLQDAAPAPNPPVDCFYVYPTVSTEATVNADLSIQPAETDAAVEQASRFSTVCRVWAPMYRQETLSSLDRALQTGNARPAAAEEIAYESLFSAFDDYLAHHNDGRPIVFIGHSQGAAILIGLLAEKFDGNPALLSRMVSAVLLGGNVTVPIGAEVGGSFQHIPVCASTTSTECVVAYSSFLSPAAPPSDSLFGIPGQGVSVQEGATRSAGLQVVCVNPSSPTVGTGTLDPFLATISAGGAVHWFEYPGLYTATCRSEGDASWLSIADVGQPGDTRPRVSQTLGPAWGLHLYDVNIALGNLVSLVAQQISAYVHQQS